MSVQPEPATDWSGVLDALEAHLDARAALLSGSALDAPGGDLAVVPPVALPDRMGAPTAAERRRAHELAQRIEHQVEVLSGALGTVRGELDRVASHRGSHTSPTVARAASSRLDQHA